MTEKAFYSWKKLNASLNDLYWWSLGIFYNKPIKRAQTVTRKILELEQF